MADEHNPEGFGHEEEHLTELQVTVREEKTVCETELRIVRNRETKKIIKKLCFGMLRGTRRLFESLFAIREGPKDLRVPDFFAVREEFFSPPSRYATDEAVQQILDFIRFS
ncbi:hypothetical protein E3N88_18435 [Mikania micrantha]|uniref:Uncharacterized protein n=1 Tax=Mikania micrantha TaxID=192012 RepID=A0A5N6NLT0_9ASTR|nr:hypothetical protein E3N88_18435 [Mikania micrantha]